jgi:hypothetical protein
MLAALLDADPRDFVFLGKTKDGGRRRLSAQAGGTVEVAWVAPGAGNSTLQLRIAHARQTFSQPRELTGVTVLSLISAFVSVDLCPPFEVCQGDGEPPKFQPKSAAVESDTGFVVGVVIGTLAGAACFGCLCRSCCVLCAAGVVHRAAAPPTYKKSRKALLRRDGPWFKFV